MSTLTIEGDNLLEDGKKIATRYYYNQQATSPAEFRGHWLAQIAFRHGLKAAIAAIEGFDRTGLPDDAILWDRIISGCGDVEVKVTRRHREHMKLLSGEEWRHFKAKNTPDEFWTFDTLWQAGHILRAGRPTSPQIWFRLPA